MSAAPNLCCDETKNRGTYTRVKKDFKGLSVNTSCATLYSEEVYASGNMKQYIHKSVDLQNGWYVTDS